VSKLVEKVSVLGVAKHGAEQEPLALESFSFIEGQYYGALLADECPVYLLG
jgi:hypothetical protein